VSPPSSSRSSVGTNERICLEVMRLELRQRPVAALELCLRDRLRRVGRHLEQEIVGVSEDDGPAERGEPVEHPARLVASLHGIPETDDPIDPEALELGDDRCERRVVAVDVRDECERHGSTIGRR